MVQNALGSDATQLTDAQTDISNGATVLLLDPIDSGVGAQIEAYAKSRGVKVIDYDHLTLGGSRAYYVSFNPVTVGKLIGTGLVSCVKAWHISKPQVVVMRGAVIDNNATLYADGYDSVINPYFKSGKWVAVARTAGTWDPATQETEFQAVYTAHPNLNAALVPNDTTAAPIITYLQSLHVKPRTFPTTGQGATLTGLQNVLAGYQCGTVLNRVLPRGAGLGGARPVPAGRGQAPVGAGQRKDPGHDRQGERPLGTRDVEVGHHRQHELFGCQAKLRAGIAALRRLVRQRLRSGGYQAVAASRRIAAPWSAVSIPRICFTAPNGGSDCGRRPDIAPARSFGRVLSP